MRLLAICIPFALAVEATPTLAGTHELADVRAVYEEVRAALQRGSLTRRERRFEYCEPYQDASRQLYASSSGDVRLYVRDAGSDDSAVTWHHYYDDSGCLRFVRITGGAVNGTEIEHTLWFATDGRKLREERKLLKGPGYTFPDPWPVEDLVKDPQQAFASPNPCKEIPGK